MKKWFFLIVAAAGLALCTRGQKSVTLEELLSAPFPENLTAAKTANRIAWTFNQEGKRNIWVAEGPAFTARRLTCTLREDGKRLGERNFSGYGDTIVCVRGEGKNANDRIAILREIQF